VFLYKPYAISLEPSRPTTSESILLKEEIDNLGKALKTLQSPTKTIQFLSPAHFNKIKKRIFNIGKKSQLNLSNKNTIQIQVVKDFQLKCIWKDYYMNCSL